MSRLPSISQSRRQVSQEELDAVSSLSQRECKAFISQLKGLLDEATAEPPKGVQTGEVERRIALLNAALQQVEGRLEELRLKKEREANEKYVQSIERRVEMQREADEKRVYNEKERRQNVQEMRNQQVYYYRDRNQKKDEMAAKCYDYNQQQQVDTIAKASSNDERRARNIENLMQARKAHTQELHEREAMRQRYAQQVNERKQTELEQERRRREEEARIREQEVEQKLAAISEAKRSKWTAKQKASRAKSRVVWENGQAILETEVKDHDKLVSDLDDKIRSQEQRYAAEQAERQYLLDVRAQQRKAAEERQQRNMVAILDRRVKRGDEIVENAHKKKERGELIKEKQATRYQDNGATLRRDVSLHQKRAQGLESDRQNDELKKNFSRWNSRAARVLADLREAMEADEEYTASQEKQKSRTNYYGDSTSSMARSSVSRAARLPSPSEFSY
ncbi:hypothetical protein AGDE_10492 [Angomonas deanei]|nr:hypothetical protein AGDE_10492 [Angomonas deanei]|eukprot:EPY28217.1 hypothetical protein AGDE_10492 [Angomonas deanei]